MISTGLLFKSLSESGLCYASQRDKVQSYIRSIGGSMVKLINKKERLNYKGSAYKGKGSINTDAATFNRLRKERPKGRSH